MRTGNHTHERQGVPHVDRLYVGACVFVYVTLLGCVVVALQL